MMVFGVSFANRPALTGPANPAAPGVIEEKTMKSSARSSQVSARLSRSVVRQFGGIFLFVLMLAPAGHGSAGALAPASRAISQLVPPKLRLGDAAKPMRYAL